MLDLYVYTHDFEFKKIMLGLLLWKQNVVQNIIGTGKGRLKIKLNVDREVFHLLCVTIRHRMLSLSVLVVIVQYLQVKSSKLPPDFEEFSYEQTFKMMW